MASIGTTQLAMILDWFSNPWIFAAVSGLGGALATIVVQCILNKRGLFIYSVLHNRVGMSAEDVIFGSVKVTWNDEPIANLYISTIELRNESLRDFQDVHVRVWSTTTSLLTERTEILGTTHFLSWTPEFAKKLEVPHGGNASPSQLNLYYGERDYSVPTMNRGQVIRLTFLNAAKTVDIPNIWVDVLHPGVRLKYRVVHQQFLGVPQPGAALTGTLLGIIIVVPVIVTTVNTPWIISTLSFVYGVTVLLPGVLILKLWQWAKDVLAD